MSRRGRNAYRERYRWHENLQGYLFASPWFIGFFVFLVFPMVFSVVLSLYQWNGITAFNERNATFVGLGNFERLMDDELFWKSLWNTAYYAFISVPLNIVTSLFLATLLNAKLRGISLFRTIFYLPNVLAGVATILMWSWLFNPDFGGFNLVLEKVGIVAAGQWIIDLVPGLAGFLETHDISWPPRWFSSEFWAKPGLIIMSLWAVGGSMLIYLAGLQGVPAHLYEVAELDGAGRLRKFWNVTLPMLTPTIFFNLVMSIIGSFQVFNQAFLMTNGQGGPNNATLMYVLYLYRKAFQHFEMGYASAMAWVLFAIIMALTLLVLKSSSLWVYYEGEVKGK
jgi:multiple sugar transport system permease protein